jgi:RHS repeat-associated protein
LATYTHDEFGVPTQATGSTSQPFRYTGELWDGGTGEPNLLYLRARYYEPGIGRFMQRDSWPGRVDTPSTLNRYTYVGNDPLKYRDPTGNQECPEQQFVDCQTAAAEGILVPEGGGLWDLSQPVIPYEPSLKRRADEIQASLGPDTVTFDRTTTAVLRAVDQKGDVHIIVATNEQYPRTNWVNSLVEGEIAVAGPGHAELNAVAFARQQGWTPVAIAASRPVCAGCQVTLRSLGTAITSPLKEYPAAGWILERLGVESYRSP